CETWRVQMRRGGGGEGRSGWTSATDCPARSPQSGALRQTDVHTHTHTQTQETRSLHLSSIGRGSYLIHMLSAFVCFCVCVCVCFCVCVCGCVDVYVCVCVCVCV